jgi:hypothetical protein
VFEASVGKVNTNRFRLIKLDVTKMMGEKYGRLAFPHIVHVKRDTSSLHCAGPSLSR